MTEVKKKNVHAVTLGRRGGLKGGPARAAKMTPQERSDSARRAVNARWAKYYGQKIESNETLAEGQLS